MTTFNQSLTRLRRFLRDPDGNIWSDDDIRVYLNDAQIEVAQKTGYIERVHAYRYPPLYTFSYMWDWEITSIEGDKYKCLSEWVTRDTINCYPWEAGYYLDSMDTADDGSRMTHPWECGYVSPGEVVKIPLHAKFHKNKYAAFDEKTIEPLGERQIALHDPYYRTCTGSPVHYYRPDQYHNEIVLYPSPSSITWDDANLMLDDASEAFGTSASDGIVSYQEDAMDETGYGIIFDIIDTENNLFMVFESLPDDVDDDEYTWDDDLAWWPPYMISSIEQATLERCYGADTDGFIPSLRDYWELRKKISIQAIKSFKNARMTDRDFQMGVIRKAKRSPSPQLPSGYPRTWP